MKTRKSRRRKAVEHIHLPSVHVRSDEAAGFDYEEDLFVLAPGHVGRVVRLVIVKDGGQVIRETFGELCDEELAQLEVDLPVLMDEGSPAAGALMRESAQNEFERQIRILTGEEKVCLGCGCSETRACSGGCGWATDQLCSNCANVIGTGTPSSIIIATDLEADRFLRARRAGA